MDKHAELMIAVYANSLEANRAYKELAQMRSRKEINFLDEAILSKDRQGRVTINEPQDADFRAGSALGMVVGGVLALLLGPAGVVGKAVSVGVAVAAGYITGGVTARGVDTGIKDSHLRDFVNKLKPTTSALIVVVDKDDAQKALQVMDALNAEIVRYDMHLDLRINS